MPNGYSRSPKLLKGALSEFSERFIDPLPNVIVFQYNPEMMTCTLEVRNQEVIHTDQEPRWVMIHPCCLVRPKLLHF